MKIAIDCRYLGKSGIGRVCEGILDALDFSAHEYVLIGKGDALKKYTEAKIIEDDSEPYTSKGLFSYAKEINRTCDVLIVPNFLIPFGVRIPVVSVMHDLAFLDVKATSRNFFDRLVKRVLLSRCMTKSKAIACVSRFTLGRCKKYFPRRAGKCFLNYNGVSEQVFSYAATHDVPEKKRDEIVFVGNVKPHKGLSILLSAFASLEGNTRLRIIGEKEGFLTGLALDEADYPNVEFTGKMENEALFEAIAGAKYLVLPSRYEGFGLPPLEALCLGTQPIVSDIPVFREVYANFPVLYFKNESELTEQLRRPPQKIDCADAVKAHYSFSACAAALIGKAEKTVKKQQ